MEIVIGIIVYVICLVVGTAIGAEKGRGADGFIYCLLLGCIGVFIIAALPSKKKQATDAARQQEQNLLLQTQQAQIVALQQRQQQTQVVSVVVAPPQQAQIPAIQDVQRPSCPVSAVPPPPPSQRDAQLQTASNGRLLGDGKLRIASDGMDLGEMTVETVKLLVKNGKLSDRDSYLDPATNEWKQIGGSCFSTSTAIEEKKFRIMSDGVQLGEMSAEAARIMIQSGKLSEYDCYYDPRTNEWKQLEELVVSSVNKRINLVKPTDA